jgi:hypothetical protein
MHRSVFDVIRSCNTITTTTTPCRLSLDENYCRSSCENTSNLPTAVAGAIYHERAEKCVVRYGGLYMKYVKVIEAARLYKNGPRGGCITTPPINELHRLSVRFLLSSTFFNANLVRARSTRNGPFMRHPCIASRITPQDFNAGTVLSCSAPVKCQNSLLCKTLSSTLLKSASLRPFPRSQCLTRTLHPCFLLTFCIVALHL